ncbi:MAG: SRPBCC family protein [Marmoricola sp.]
MDTRYGVAESRVVAADPERTFEAVLPAPLTGIFTHRFWVIPPIREVLDQPGTWGTVGQTRTIVLADGGRMHEELTAVQPGVGFEYRISQVSGPMKPVVSGAEGRWTFQPAPGGTRITWSWQIEPTRQGLRLMPVFGWFWRGYARRALAEIEDQLAAGD